jgi:hypothetical protein
MLSRINKSVCPINASVRLKFAQFADFESCVLACHAVGDERFLASRFYCEFER